MNRIQKQRVFDFLFRMRSIIFQSKHDNLGDSSDSHWWAPCSDSARNVRRESSYLGKSIGKRSKYCPSDNRERKELPLVSMPKQRESGAKVAIILDAPRLMIEENVWLLSRKSFYSAQSCQWIFFLATLGILNSRDLESFYYLHAITQDIYLGRRNSFQ